MDTLGFSRIRVAYTAGDAIGPDIFNFYRSLGMNLKQVYGQTEASVFVTIQRNGQIKNYTVGTPADDVEVRVAENGEVLYRGAGVFHSYHKDPAATRATKDAEGWVHTGDAGYFNGDGHLTIIDRVNDLGRLNDGTSFAPKYIENKLKFSPYIKEAVAFGDRRDYVTVFINIDPLSVSNWAQQRNLSYSGYAGLASKEEVYELIGECVEKVNRELAEDSRQGISQIRRFLILHKELDADDGELTRTRKVRRHFIAEKYASLIDSLYAGKDRCHVETKVKFEDGRIGVVRADLSIREARTYVWDDMVPPLRKAG
jgi:long-chain acyl-CoA synthetase